MRLNSENACYYSVLTTFILQFATLKRKD